MLKEMNAGSPTKFMDWKVGSFAEEIEWNQVWRDLTMRSQSNYEVYLLQ